MKQLNVSPDAATGKPAMNKAGSSNLYGYEVDSYTCNLSNMGNILEVMCDMCIDIVKEGGNAAYVYDRFSLGGFDFGVGLALHTVDGGLWASLHTRSTMKSDLSEVRNKWGAYVISYLKKRGLVGNKSFAKRVKKCEVSPEDAALLTSAFFEENVGSKLVA